MSAGAGLWLGCVGCTAAPACCCRLSEACLSGRQTGQSLRVQFFQCEMICREEAQWGTGHVLPAWQLVMWFSTFFIVRQ
uniref:Putative secreted protein n=1 Tax=Ixodes ricinus TaxID=34613 RepID=A0A6B0TV04_IXORI